MQALYNATDGDNWHDNTGWDFTTDPSSSWEGVTVTDGRVTRLQLVNNNLKGSLPAELGDLSELTYLQISDHQETLTGAIPSELGKLAKLTQLRLNHNRLSGSIPTRLGGLSKLTRLYLHSNLSLSGTIPPELGDLSELQLLYLNSNNLDGQIPVELGNLSNLERLYLYGNDLRGSIPGELGSISQLQWLSVARNQLSGKLPSELGGLTKIARLHVYGNELYGPIPSSFTNMVSLYDFRGYENDFCILARDTEVAAWYGNIQQRNPGSLRACDPPTAPTGFTASLSAGGSGADLSWTDPQDADITGWQYRHKEGSGEYGDWTTSPAAMPQPPLTAFPTCPQGRPTPSKCEPSATKEEAPPRRRQA